MKPDKIPDENSNRTKDPDDWVTGDEEMTGAQASYLQTLAEQAHGDNGHFLRHVGVRRIMVIV